MASFPFVHPPIIKSNENNNLRFKIFPFVLMKLDRGVTTVLFHFLNFVQLLKHNWHTDKKKSSIVLTLGHIAGKEKRNKTFWSNCRCVVSLSKPEVNWACNRIQHTTQQLSFENKNGCCLLLCWCCWFCQLCGRCKSRDLVHTEPAIQRILYDDDDDSSQVDRENVSWHNWLFARFKYDSFDGRHCSRLLSCVHDSFEEKKRLSSLRDLDYIKTRTEKSQQQVKWKEKVPPPQFDWPQWTHKHTCNKYVVVVVHVEITSNVYAIWKENIF